MQTSSADNNDYLKIMPTIYSRQLVRRLAARWWWAVALVGVAAFGMLPFDWRVSLACLMILLICFPFMMIITLGNASLYAQVMNARYFKGVCFSLNEIKLIFDGKPSLIIPVKDVKNVRFTRGIAVLEFGRQLGDIAVIPDNEETRTQILKIFNTVDRDDFLA